ncbi:TPA_asm: division septum protein Blr, partial [Salmonella enterica subsp. enterica serovar Dublin]|nr:division septum protein Blr [Salmonella enterica]EAV3156674.1 division septum protein Blr [Salmonella enterica]EAX6916400.1 division septum protein Blr [Salmonella enterica]HAB2155039.1 division septum protein Blr [Salmonella enterica subsp. enterica serovar Dublin]
MFMDKSKQMSSIMNRLIELTG